MKMGKTMLLAVVGIATLAATTSGQQARGAATLDDVLQELRGMRADLNRSAAAGVRMQALVARLALQEQRLNTLNAQLTELNEAAAEAASNRQAVEAALKRYEDAQSGAATVPMPSANIPGVIGGLRQELEQAQAREQQARERAAALTGTIAAERDRWADFNNRLDELERSLPAAGQR